MIKLKKRKQSRVSRRARLTIAAEMLRVPVDKNVLFDVCRTYRNKNAKLLDLFKAYAERV